MLNTVISSIKKHGGFGGAFKAWLRLYLGIKDQQNNLETLNYLLNEYVDITQLPPTKDDNLRILQKCDAALIAIFDKICAKYNLRYWLFAGTLLGAVRHKGFIPWDDDVDITMPREDYNKALEIMPKELEKLGLDFNVRDLHPYARFGIGYKHYESGIWIDVFTIDSFKTDQTIDELYAHDAISVEKKVRDHFNKMEVKDIDKQIAYRNHILHHNESGSHTFYFDNMEFSHFHPIFYQEEDIFPLIEMPFENYMFKCPHNYDTILKRKYGDYMKFPKSGCAHHYISSWSEKSNMNMEEAHKHLLKILESL